MAVQPMRAKALCFVVRFTSTGGAGKVVFPEQKAHLFGVALIKSTFQ